MSDQPAELDDLAALRQLVADAHGHVERYYRPRTGQRDTHLLQLAMSRLGRAVRILSKLQEAAK